LKNAINETNARRMQNYSYLNIAIKDIALPSQLSLGGICPLNRGIFYVLDFPSSEELHNSDETSHYDATPNADCSLVVEPELSPAPSNQVSYRHQKTDPLAIFRDSGSTTAVCKETLE
jgi:hypothetical protein